MMRNLLSHVQTEMVFLGDRILRSQLDRVTGQRSQLGTLEYVLTSFLSVRLFGTWRFSIESWTVLFSVLLLLLDVAEDFSDIVINDRVGNIVGCALRSRTLWTVVLWSRVKIASIIVKWSELITLSAPSRSIMIASHFITGSLFSSTYIDCFRASRSRTHERVIMQIGGRYALHVCKSALCRIKINCPSIEDEVNENTWSIRLQLRSHPIRKGVVGLLIEDTKTCLHRITIRLALVPPHAMHWFLYEGGGGEMEGGRAKGGGLEEIVRETKNKHQLGVTKLKFENCLNKICY